MSRRDIVRMPIDSESTEGLEDPLLDPSEVRSKARSLPNMTVMTGAEVERGKSRPYSRICEGSTALDVK